ncbi:hypothetical protein RJT34_26947 [Clitoria ternatea]|uniref:non-specific serine/threonine protein kinase n=1 Tax=Clitoria ternatea TaxID=43366 RepID=A0AAN9IBU6_CLITE
MFSLVMGSGFNLLGCFFTRTSNSIDIFPNYAQSKLQMFPYKEIKAATNFQHHLLKEAYGGRLYHGMLKDGREVAVQCLKMFQHNFIEYDVIMKCLPHKNIMSMYGYARHYRETLVVHEYISNVASLAAHLYGEIAESDTLPWLTRLDIAIDTANALCHLHRHGIMHLDVNPSNILLDMNFHAKLANFILSWKFTKNGSVYDEQEVDSVIATVACLDPAYLGSCRANGKNDVHSFGMVLYDLISSKPSRQWIQSETVNYSDDEPDDCLASLLRRNIENQSLVELVDPKLGFQSHHKIKQMMTATAELAFQCMQCPVESRPNMEQVLEILNGIRLIETKHPLEESSIILNLKKLLTILTLALEREDSALSTMYAKPMSTLLYSLFALSIILITCSAEISNTSAICAPSSCGNLSIRYPFWRKSNSIIGGEICGYPEFGLECTQGNKAIITLPSDTYYVTDINYVNHTITLVDIDILNQPCPRAKHNVSIENLPLSFTSLDLNLSFYFNCSSYPAYVDPIGCMRNSYDRDQSYVFVAGEEAENGFEWLKHCDEHVVVTVKQDVIGSVDLITGFGDAMKKGFVLDWMRAGDCAECERSGGNCVYDQAIKQARCICKDGSNVAKSCKKGTHVLA